MASPLDYNTHYLHNWISDPRDILFRAQHSSLSSRFSGISICHPIYDNKAMASALRHAIYFAILNTEATATFMFLPASIWNAAARVHLNNHNPTWLGDLAKDIPEAKWYANNVRNDPIQNARHTDMPATGKCKKLSQDKKQIAKVPHKPAADITTPIPYGSCQAQDGKTVIGAGVYHPMSDSKNLVEPNGADITNTIGRAELATIAALTHTHTHTLPRTASAHFTNSKSKSCIQRTSLDT
eukprot:1161467-Pelagomonas_calceolata.AAC.7